MTDSQPPEEVPLLQSKGLTVYRGDEPLFADIDLTLSTGEILQIEGSNGSGKTTLLRVLCALAYADEGDVFWRGKNLRQHRSEFYAETLYLGHKPGIKAELSAVENLRLYLSLGQTSGQAVIDDATIEQALEAVQLSGREDLPCGVLSAGQQRRVALARLILTSARLWILDEPLTALDLEGRNMVQRILENHVIAGGSLLYTTHQALPVPGLNTRSMTMGDASMQELS